MKASDFINQWAEHTKKMMNESYDKHMHNPDDSDRFDHEADKYEEIKKAQEEIEKEIEKLDDVKKESEDLHEEVEQLSADLSADSEQLDEGVGDWFKKMMNAFESHLKTKLDKEQWKQIAESAKENGKIGVKKFSEKVVGMLKNNEHAEIRVTTETQSKRKLSAATIADFQGMKMLLVSILGTSGDQEQLTLDTLEKLMNEKHLKKFSNDIDAIVYINSDDKNNQEFGEGKVVTEIESDDKNMLIFNVKESISMNQQKDNLTKAELFS